MSEFNKVKNVVDKTIGATCQACNRLFSPEKLAQMEKHIIDECTKVQKK
ncbi:7533_t:CDS:2 [Gigaspora rosea]|nr:7533_t:CDS:2 [Gigaspora rosea]